MNPKEVKLGLVLKTGALWHLAGLGDLRVRWSAVAARNEPAPGSREKPRGAGRREGERAQRAALAARPCASSRPGRDPGQSGHSAPCGWAGASGPGNWLTPAPLGGLARAAEAEPQSCFWGGCRPERAAGRGAAAGGLSGSRSSASRPGTAFCQPGGSGFTQSSRLWARARGTPRRQMPNVRAKGVTSESEEAPREKVCKGKPRGARSPRAAACQAPGAEGATGSAKPGCSPGRVSSGTQD